MNEPRTIEESYTSAGNADDLTVTPDRRTDADVLIAADVRAWCAENGVALRDARQWSVDLETGEIS